MGRCVRRVWPTCKQKVTGNRKTIIHVQPTKKRCFLFGPATLICITANAPLLQTSYNGCIPCSFLYIHFLSRSKQQPLLIMHSANQNARQTPTGHMTVFPVLFLEYTRVEVTWHFTKPCVYSKYSPSEFAERFDWLNANELWLLSWSWQEVDVEERAWNTAIVGC